MFRENLMSAFFAKITIFLILIVIVISNSSFAEEDCNKLEDKVPCLASQGDTWAMCVIARREYDLARTSRLLLDLMLIQSQTYLTYHTGLCNRLLTFCFPL